MLNPCRMAIDFINTPWGIGELIIWAGGLNRGFYGKAAISVRCVMSETPSARSGQAGNEDREQIATKPVGAASDLKCGEVIGERGKDLSTGRAPLIDLSGVREGTTFAVSTSPIDLGLPDEDREAHPEANGVPVEVYRVRGRSSAGTPSDIWGTTPSGADLHIYVRRGKVERIDSDVPADAPGTSSLLNCPGYMVREQWCNDGSECEAAPSKILSLGDVEIAVCGHHGEDGREVLADLADEEPAGRRRLRPDRAEGMEKDPLERTPEDYDVSGHPALADESDDESDESDDDGAEPSDSDDGPLMADGGTAFRGRGRISRDAPNLTTQVDPLHLPDSEVSAVGKSRPEREPEPSDPPGGYPNPMRRAHALKAILTRLSPEDRARDPRVNTTTTGSVVVVVPERCLIALGEALGRLGYHNSLCAVSGHSGTGAATVWMKEV